MDINFRKAVNYVIYRDLAKDDNDVAQRIGQEKGNFSKYKNGKLPVSAKLIEKFEETFGIDIRSIDNQEIAMTEKMQDALRDLAAAQRAICEAQRDAVSIFKASLSERASTSTNAGQKEPPASGTETLADEDNNVLRHEEPQTG